DENAMPSAAQIAQWTRQAAQIEQQVLRHNDETASLLQELDDARMRAHAECVRRQRALERTTEQLQSHVERYFGLSEPWQDQRVQSLATTWSGVLMLATCDAPDIQTVSELVRWCQSLDRDSWSRFHERWHELRSLDSLLTPDPSAAAARDEAI